MKVTKSLKMLIAMFLLVVGFAITGNTAEAAIVTNLRQSDEVSQILHNVKITWTGLQENVYYGITIATDPLFKDIVTNEYTWTKETEYYANLPGGKTYYVKVGNHKNQRESFDNNCCNTITIVTAPKEDMRNLKFVNADEKTATIKWEPVQGANEYKIKYNGTINYTQNTEYKIPLVDGLRN